MFGTGEDKFAKMSATDGSQKSPALRLRLLIDSIGDVAREPGYGNGYHASGETISFWMPPQDERPMQLRVCMNASSQFRSWVGLDGTTAALHGWNWDTGEALPATTALAALEAAEQLLAKLNAQRREWSTRIDASASERIIRAFFSPWPQALTAALAAFERQRGLAPVRRPMEMDTEDPGVQIWLAAFAEGHLRGLRLVDFSRERDPIWIADRFREQPEPPSAPAFRAAREAKLRPAAVAAAIDGFLATVGWRLVMFDVMYGKPMPAELAQQVVVDAPAAGFTAHLRIALGGEAFQ